jgi:threonine/homoserine efflux transporter RhtA
LSGVAVLRILVLIVIVVAAVYVWRTWRLGRRRMDQERAAADFARYVPKLQEDFRAAANTSGKPRGLRWKACEFQGPLYLARDRANGELIGLVGATISFEAIEGGGMEEVEAVGNLRAVTAILTWSGFDWTTTGKAVFNLEPREVLERYSENLTPIG